MSLIDVATDGFNAGVTLISGLHTVAEQLAGLPSGLGVVVPVLMIVLGLFMVEHTGPVPRETAQSLENRARVQHQKRCRKEEARRRRHVHEMASSIMMANRRG